MLPTGNLVCSYQGPPMRVRLLKTCTTLILAAMWMADPSSAAPTVSRIWGTQGSSPGQFYYPYGIAVSPAGDVYVSDQYNYRIQRFTSTGDFISAWGSQGPGPGQFQLTIGIGIDSQGTVYVADYGNDRVQVFTPSGAFIRQWGMVKPRDVAIDPSGLIHVVADGLLGSIEVFTSNGVHVSTWGNGLLKRPTSITFDASGSAYVTEADAQQVSKWNSSHQRVLMWGSDGSGPGQFHAPSGVAISPDGSVLVTDFSNDRVQQFSSDGAFKQQWGALGSAPGQFSSPADVAIDAGGNIYVVELGNHRVQKFLDLATPTTRVSWGGLKHKFR
jgi:DNA-binding beta-propeller fold protein YncE